ncbi:hypothetical protein HAX39_24980 [Citrobacter freundii]|nr:hypothetical protein [Citrobacter freundii]
MLPATSPNTIHGLHSFNTPQPPATSNVLKAAHTIIQQTAKLPGCTSGATSDEIQHHRTALLECWSALATPSGCFHAEGEDTAIRPVVVGMQAIIEQSILQMLDEGQLAQVSVMFTTQKPPTPLCSAPDLVSDRQATPAVLNSSGCVDTITSRQHLLRKLIADPKVDMTSYYVDKHSENEQHYFDHFSCLHSTNFHPCHVNEIPDNLSGATYKLTTTNNQTHMFGIRFTQASVSSRQCTLFTDGEVGKKEMELVSKWVSSLSVKPEDTHSGQFMRS